MTYRRRTLPILFSVLVLTLLTAGMGAEAQPVTSTEIQPDEELDSWIASLGEPGEGHQVLESMVGTWEGKGTIWDGPDTEPIAITATVDRHWVLGGRYLREEISVRSPDGQMFETLGFIGFNNEAGQYELLTIDNASTGMVFETGKFDPDSEKLMIRGSFRDPATGYVIDSRVEMDLSQDGRIVVVGYNRNEEGREYKSLEGAITRRKK
jgi:hypothetical protein